MPSVMNLPAKSPKTEPATTAAELTRVPVITAPPFSSLLPKADCPVNGKDSLPSPSSGSVSGSRKDIRIDPDTDTDPDPERIVINREILCLPTIKTLTTLWVRLTFGSMDKDVRAQGSDRLDRIRRIRELMPAGDPAYAELAEFFKLLGDPTRIKILLALGASELCVSEIADLLDMNQSAISHQLRLLSRSGLVRPSKAGKNVYYAVSDRHIRTVLVQALEHVQE